MGVKDRRHDRRRDPRRRRTLPLEYETASIDPRDETAAPAPRRVEPTEQDTEPRAGDGATTDTTEAEE